jgi:hypothetical protein
VNEVDLKRELRLIIQRHVGRAEAVTAGLLAQSFGFKDDRVIRKAIEDLIEKDGFPVCSVTEEPAGYFFPENVNDARTYSKALQKRAVNIFLRRRNIIKNTAIFYEKARQAELV